MTLSLLAQAGESASPGGAISWLWLTIALPLAGFLINGALSIWRPRAKSAVSLVGTTVLIAAFAVAVAIFLQLWQAPPEEPYILRLWTWLPVERFRIDFALQIDRHALEISDHALDLGHSPPLFVDLKFLQADQRFT